jgi:protein-S-isoprenylcysteine O-methyltransferase Ste14
LLSWAQVARRIRVPLGFALAVAYLWLAHPTLEAMAGGAVLVTAGLWLRARSSGHVRKNEALATSGPYAYTRNPLYLGSMLIAVGFALAARNWWIGILLVAMLLAIYLPVIRSEEEFLRNQFPEFQNYAREVPRLLPRLTANSGTTGSHEFSRALYLQHREYNALLGAMGMMAALAVKLVFLPRWFPR